MFPYPNEVMYAAFSNTHKQMQDVLQREISYISTNLQPDHRWRKLEKTTTLQASVSKNHH
jgi:hypothetical protein